MKLKEKLTKLQEYEEALYRVLDSTKLELAKEYAADALGENLDEYLYIETEDATDDLDFYNNEDGNIIYEE